jgi:hypothetical protein
MVTQAATFTSPDHFFQAMFGPSQHDAHVETYKGDKWLTERSAANKRVLAAVASEVDKIIAEWRSH